MDTLPFGHNAIQTHCMKHLWLRPSACGKVNRAFSPARSSSIVSGPRHDSKALCRQLRVVLGRLKKIMTFCQKANKRTVSECCCVGMALCQNVVVREWRYVVCCFCKYQNVLWQTVGRPLFFHSISRQCANEVTCPCNILSVLGR